MTRKADPAKDETAPDPARAIRLGRIFEESLNEIYVFDAADLHFVEVNRGARDNLGYPPEEMARLTPVDLKPDLDAAAFAELLAPLRSGEAEVVRFRTRHRRRDGTHYPVEVKLQLIDGERPVFVAIIDDTSERDEALRAAEEARGQLEAAVEALEDGFVYYDAEDRLVMANGRFRKIYERSAAAIRPGVTFDDFVRHGLERGQYGDVGPDPQAWLIERKRVHRQHAARFEQRLGDGRMLRIYKKKTADGGMVGLHVDITELHDARTRAEAASRAKSLFLAGMSHEIRTPLNGVLGMAELLEGALDDPDKRAMAGVIRSSGALLLSILNDILDVSKIEAGRMSLAVTAFTPAGIGQHIDALHRLNAERKGLDFSVLLGRGANRARLGDPLRIEQILHNVVGNAIKFTEAGEVEATIEAAPGAPLRLRVRDTGPGMTEAQLARVFGEYEQGDDAVARRYGGYGLGLSIVRRLVQAMRGEVSIDSRPGEGTCVTVTLPLPEEEAETGHAAGTGGLRLVRDSGDGPTAAGGLAGLSVLLAEDNPTNQLILRSMLERLGLAVTIAPDGVAALEEWKPGRFDIVLLDISMPRMDGVAALLAIRAEERRAGLRAGPVIAVTANAMAEQVAEYRGLGFDGHVTKPVTLGTLAAALAAVRPLVENGS